MIEMSKMCRRSAVSQWFVSWEGENVSGAAQWLMSLTDLPALADRARNEWKRGAGSVEAQSMPW